LNNNIRDNNKLTSVVLKSFETKLRGASDKRADQSESLYVRIVNRRIGMPGSYDGQAKL